MISMIDALIDTYDKSVQASHSEILTDTYPKTEKGSNNWWHEKYNHYNDSSSFSCFPLFDRDVCGPFRATERHMKVLVEWV